MAVDLKAKPFELKDEQIRWVRDALAAMSLEEKIGQLICGSTMGLSKGQIKQFTETYKIGGIMLRPLSQKTIQRDLRALQSAAKVPLLVAANLEYGGEGVLQGGTYFATPEGCAATGDIVNGYRLGKIACSEARSAGVNWAFAPIADIDMNYQNPITNIRSFGGDKNTVLEMTRGYIKAANEEGVAPTIKHFPGDGTDERDQHLLVSVNRLSAADWHASYGMIYQTLIAEGAPCVMAGHIAQPEVARDIQPGISREDAFLPASQSKTLLMGVLREKYGFNGVIVTDSTLMVGYMQCMPRRLAIPASIENGCDVILFNRNLKEDFTYLMEGYKDGLLSEGRLIDAVTRILALKARLNLYASHKNGEIVPNVDFRTVITSPQTREWVKECADKAVTLVKDNRKLLPLSPQKAKRIYLNVIENFVENDSDFARDIKTRFKREGFDVTLRKRALRFNPKLMMKGIITPSTLKALREIMANTDSFVSKYDMAVIVLNMETTSNATVVRVNWNMMFGLGNDIPWYAGEMPLLVVSVANPYHLLDIPMARAYVNAYSNNKETLDAVFEKIMGRSAFKGISPIDPFCGHEECGL
jgi:beta-N-acetylhexosaminidase